MDGTTYNSLELRWFVPGEIPTPVVDTFTSNAPFVVEEWRHDSYRPSSRADIGVKRRNGGPIEMKLRRSARPWRHPSALDAVTEQWTKWRPDRLSVTGWDDDWIEVGKHLWTRTFAVSGREVPGPVDGMRPRCEVEIAQLSVGSTDWWTIAFEATGPARAQPLVLRSAFECVWSSELDRSVDGGVSAGYPEWLERHGRLTAIR